MNLSRTAFHVDQERITVGEVLAGCLLGGWLQPLQHRIAGDLAAEAFAHERGTEIPEQALQAALNEWRTSRDLIAAEEFEQWIESTGLDIDQLAAHLERRALRSRLSPSLDLSRHAPEWDLVLQLTPSEAALGGELEGLIALFARCAASHGEERPDTPEEAERRERYRREALDVQGAGDLAELAPVLEELGASVERAEWLLEAAVSYRLQREDTLTPEALGHALRDYRDDLVRYDLLSAACPSEDIALEMVCCVRVDSDPFTRAAARAGVPCRKESLYGTDIGKNPFGARLPSAPVREVFGPLAAEGRFLIGQLQNRQEPGLSETAVVDQLSQRLLDRVLRRPLAERIRFPGPAGVQPEKPA